MFSLISAAKAQGLQDAFGNILTDTANQAGYGTTSNNDLLTSVSNIIFLVLYMLGTIFLLIIIYSGIRWMTAGGNEHSIEKAKNTINQAIIGLIVVVGAYALSFFFIRILM